MRYERSDKMSIIQISIIGITGVLAAIKLKNIKSEYSLVIILATSVLIGFFCITKLENVIFEIRNIMSKAGVKNEYVAILLKITGIAYCCQLGEDLCNDAGYSVISHQIQIYGKLTIIFVSFPIFRYLIETIYNLSFI